MNGDLKPFLEARKRLNTASGMGDVRQAFIGDRYFEKRNGAWVEVDFETGEPVVRV